MSLFEVNYNEFHLNNGLLVVLKETPTETFSAKLRVHHGALHEKTGEEGIAHFLEHNLINGGTRKFDVASSEKIKALFGSYNAYTSLDQTTFPVASLPEDVQPYLEFVSDLVFHPRMDPTVMEQERQRVLRETSDEKSKPTFKDLQALMHALYGKNAPQKYFILGEEKVVAAATKQNLKEFHERGYHPNNMELIIVGKLPPNIEELIIGNFAGAEQGPGKKFEFPSLPPLAGKTILHTKAPEMYSDEHPEESSASLSIYVRAPSDRSDEFYAAVLLDHILGGGPSSRLFNTISKEKGLAYAINSSYSGTHNAGTFGIDSSIRSTESDEAINAIFNELGKLREELG